MDVSDNYKHIIEQLKQLNPGEIKDLFDYSQGQYAEIFEEQKKVTDTAHEIVFKLTANVLEQNEKGEYTKSKGMFEQNYHIPVPIGTVAKDYVDAFFDFIKQQIIDGIDAADKKTQGTK